MDVALSGVAGPLDGFPTPNWPASPSSEATLTCTAPFKGDETLYRLRNY